jgi:hypothetical protein
MSTAANRASSEVGILRRIVDRKHASLSEEAARAILRLDFDMADRRRMNRLAAKNRAGQITSAEEKELDNFIHIGQVLGVLRSKARQALRENGLDAAKS